MSAVAEQLKPLLVVLTAEDRREILAHLEDLDHEQSSIPDPVWIVSDGSNTSA